MARFILTFVFLIFVLNSKADKRRGFITAALEEKFENSMVLYANNFEKWLEKVNDSHLSNTEIGKLLHYNEIKSKLSIVRDASSEFRSMKKLSMALLPIIFHVGATSTWLVLTGLMAAKSVAIGIILLVFKIAVSSAKVASFFTAWKHKNPHLDTWAPHYEHGHLRRLEDTGTHELPYASYSPDPVWNSEYKTLSTETDPEHYVGDDLKGEIGKRL